MSRIDEIASYHTAEEMYETGMDYLNGTNGKVRLETNAVKYLNKAACMGSQNAKDTLKRLKSEGLFTDDDDQPVEVNPDVIVERL